MNKITFTRKSERKQQQDANGHTKPATRARYTESTTGKRTVTLQAKSDDTVRLYTHAGYVVALVYNTREKLAGVEVYKKGIEEGYIYLTTEAALDNLIGTDWDTISEATLATRLYNQLEL